MDEYLLHEEYYKSVRGEDGEEPLEALGSPPHTDIGTYPVIGPQSDDRPRVNTEEMWP